MMDAPAPGAALFKLVPFDKIEVPTERAYLVKGIIPREALVVVWGPPKSVKSFWTFDVLMHVALGWEYRGRPVTQGSIVYISCEGEHGIGARVEAYRRRHLAEDHDPVPFYLMLTRLNLIAQHELLIARIKEQLGTAWPGAIAIDTLNRSLTGSESKDEDMSAYVQAADAVREAFRCAVVLIHHCGIDGSRPRGHTSLTAACDAQLSVKRDKNGIVTVTVEYMKDGPQGETIGSRLEVVEVGTDETGDPITSCIVEPVDGPLAKTGARVGGQVKIALDLLERAIADAGEIPPASNHIPGGQNRVVRLTLWRGYCKDGGLTEGDNTEAFKKAWQRVRTNLQSRGFVGVWDNKVWLATAEGDKGT